MQFHEIPSDLARSRKTGLVLSTIHKFDPLFLSTFTN